MQNRFKIIICLFIFNLTINILSAGTIKNTISPPSGYKRIEYNKITFSGWVQNLTLKEKKIILDYNGSRVISFYNIFAVVDKPILFKNDLEQCADYCMRLWVDYHKEINRTDKLYLFNYNGEKQYYKDFNKNLYSFLKYYMAYSNSYSLKKGCKEISENDLIPGDMLVQNETGGIGHVSMIVDVCKNDNNQKLYLIGYSFMPAQEFHIEKANSKYGKNGWFTLEGYYRYLRNNLDFGNPVLRRF